MGSYRVMRDPVYRERMRRAEMRGRRQAWATAIFVALVVGGMSLGIGVVASRADARPIASGGGRVMVTRSPLEKWVKRWAVRRSHGSVNPATLHVECRGAVCAGYDGKGVQLIVQRMADGHFRVRMLLLPDLKGIA